MYFVGYFAKPNNTISVHSWFCDTANPVSLREVFFSTDIQHVYRLAYFFISHGQQMPENSLSI